MACSCSKIRHAIGGFRLFEGGDDDGRGNFLFFDDGDVDGRDNFLFFEGVDDKRGNTLAVEAEYRSMPEMDKMIIFTTFL